MPSVLLHAVLRLVLPVLVAYAAGSSVHWSTMQSLAAGLSLVMFANWAATLGRQDGAFDAFDHPWLCRAAIVTFAAVLVAAFIFGRADLAFDPGIASPVGPARTHFRVVSFAIVLLPAVPFAVRTAAATALGRQQ